mmetsp:Transcript_100250/g.239034  ORF Transcript_100250/g.239034 Transcript_100250/m.239034 type:complete len:82 (-) Transcript_100250:7-252(-)
MPRWLLALLCLGVHAAEQAEYKRDFMEFDLNKDNQIDFQELRIHVRGELDEQQLRRMVIEMDKDQSGTISMEEYLSYALTM